MAALQFLWCLLPAFFSSCRHVEGASGLYQEKTTCDADVEANAMLQLKDELPHPSECIRYSYTFPLELNGQVFLVFILRLYNPVDTTASIPTVSVPLGARLFENALAEAADGNFKGAWGNGIDQYAIYYEGYPVLNLTERQRVSKRNATVSGFFPNVAYSSLQLMYGTSKDDMNMYEVAASSYDTTGVSGKKGKPNPFIAGSPTVLAYTHQAECVAHGTSLLAKPNRQKGSPRGPRGSPETADVACKDTNTNIYRLSADMTVAVMADSATGECSDSYLIAPAPGIVAKYPDQDFNNVDVYNFSWGFIRMKVPLAFNNSGMDVYDGSYTAANSDGYDLNYWSVSANVAHPGPDPNVPYTVNALMMDQEGMMTSTGHSYVLFAPSGFVINMTAANSTIPPKVNLPKMGISAYVLAAPSYAFLFRYKDPSPDWPGSTENVPCVQSTAEMNASVGNCETLGIWAPQITRIGDVETLEQLASIVEV